MQKEQSLKQWLVYFFSWAIKDVQILPSLLANCPIVTYTWRTCADVGICQCSILGWALEWVGTACSHPLQAMQNARALPVSVRMRLPTSAAWRWSPPSIPDRFTSGAFMENFKSGCECASFSVCAAHTQACLHILLLLQTLGERGQRPLLDWQLCL